jgi:hypothetical protein
MNAVNASYNWIQTDRSTLALAFGVGNTERARIDSSGRLLVGTSTSVAVDDGVAVDSQLQVVGSSASATIARSVGSARLFLARNQTVVADSQLGKIGFQGGDGSNLLQAASILAAVDGTPGANDMPGRLVFSTTADGASSPTERVRLTNTGALLVGTTTTPTGASSGAVVAQNRTVIGSINYGTNLTVVGDTGAITATTGTIVFKFKNAYPGAARTCYAKISVSCRTNSNTVGNNPAAEYAFQLHNTTSDVCTVNGDAAIFEYIFDKTTDFSFSSLGGGECTVTLANPTGAALNAGYKVEILSNIGAWGLDSVTVT